MDTTTYLFVCLVLGCVGMGYVVYGKRQALMTPIFCGMALIALPYFVANVWLMAALALLFLALPFIVGS